MPYIYVPPSKILPGRVVIEGSEFHHVIHVLKIGRGERITLFDGGGKEYTAVVDSIGKGFLEVSIEEERERTALPGIRIHLYQSIIKAKKFEKIVALASELGVSRITPVVSRRCVKQELRIDRLRHIARSALSVSGLPVPEIADSPLPLDDCFLMLPEKSHAFLLWEEERSVSAEIAFSSLRPGETCSLFVGPEGGFTADETERARQAGIKILSLGKRIFRAETAALAAIVLILRKGGGFDL